MSDHSATRWSVLCQLFNVILETLIHLDTFSSSLPLSCELESNQGLFKVVTAEPIETASYIEICSRNDPNIENCIINSIEKVRPKLLTGIPELDVPPIEPLVLKEVVVSRGANAAIFRAVGSNVKVYGPAQFQITGLKVDLKNMVFYINLKLPELYFDGDYDVNARILILPLRGKGPIKANATDCTADVVLRGQVYKKKGEDYLRFQSIEIDLKIGKFHVHLDNLFGGDKVLGKWMVIVAITVPGTACSVEPRTPSVSYLYLGQLAGL
uniref:Uncharacterized protein n=2 Tax=Timema TaxID=61471 RepID=A0A7R9BAL4_TIMSH|nr:unnamed protein product [Timema shepardi]